MSEISIGIDPGSTKGHGVSTYRNGILIDLRMCELMQLLEYIQQIRIGNNVTVHIEDVFNQKGVWHDEKGSKKSYGKTSQNVGLCKWAQIEVERMCKHIDMPIVRHKVSSKWKKADQKAQFQKVTGWIRQSNEDTRSAAWFGWLGCN